MEELFPDYAADARRERIHKARAERVCARMRLESAPTGAVDVILAAMREHGAGDCLLIADWVMERIGVAADDPERSDLRLRTLATLFNMAAAGILWRHDVAEDVTHFGIRGEHPKAAHVADLIHPITYCAMMNARNFGGE